MLRPPSAQNLVMGLLTAFVGFASSFAVVLQGLSAVGATPAQMTSGLAILCLTQGAAAILLSLRTRIPISTAWSTPGAALLATSGAVAGGFPAAVGGFLICGLMLTIAGLWAPLGRLVARIPMPLASAMLAGVLLGLCFAPARALASDPLLALPIVLAWVIVGAVKRLYAVPAALVAFILVLIFGIDHPAGVLDSLALGPMPPLEFVMPVFTLQAMIGIALPLFIVTMASQNIPGIAVLRVNGYAPKAGPLFATTGIFSALAAPFGGHAVNLAAITAAMAAGSESHPDPARRYWTAVIAGGVYLICGLATGALTALVALAPPILIQAVAGLALIGAFAGAATAAFHDPKSREAAAITFIVTASGITLAGISGAFWGLIAGGAVHLLHRRG